jgi:hypothetical protein|tara:strand:- start:2725 stop:3699 length:975 start_codon:yes stop_codon:yes gene_type:complete
MGLAGQNQVRHMYVGDAPSGVSTMATLKSAGVSSDLIILSADGSAVAAGGSFKLFQKDALGNVISSDTIKADNVLSAKSVAHVAAANKAVTISSLSVDVNTLYTVKIEIDQHGSLSQEDTYLKQGYYKAVTGDDAEAIVDGLIASLNRNFSREIGATSSSNPYFSFSKTGTAGSAALVVTGKTQSSKFDGNKHIKVVDSFSVDIACDTYPSVEVTTAANSGKGTGFQIVEMEYYLLGERGDAYRTNGYPFNLTAKGAFADSSKSYNLIEVSYYDEGRDEAKKSKKGLTIAVPFTTLAGNSKINAVIADLNTVLGSGTVETLATS